ncbi:MULTISPECIES: DUF456 domain-containing protein [Bacillaceae]|uniref:DUF456 family protein n=1 Tax=Evansella alkalicola TaxID=745819 RepID=A0ABS6JSJ8_9BACI|nr:MULTISPECIES: DUF456 family protein [Bacillaceae]MBU9721534.1 DUF456 family protein [Bacillus alkalicola]
MEILLWILISLLFIISFIGLFYPIIPGVLLIWLGVLTYHFFISATGLSWWLWICIVLLTILIFIADIMANLFFVKKYGGSQQGMRAATLGLIVGCFVIPPFGVIVVPFIFVFVTEMLQQKTSQEALKVSVGTLLAFLSGTFAKALIQLTIIIVFLIDALLF